LQVKSVTFHPTVNEAFGGIEWDKIPAFRTTLPGLAEPTLQQTRVFGELQEGIATYFSDLGANRVFDKGY
jgi:hypothetical protein